MSKLSYLLISLIFSKMSNKISDYFKIDPKFSQEDSETSAEVKNEKEANFDIKLEELEPLKNKTSSNAPKIHECRVILHAKVVSNSSKVKSANDHKKFSKLNANFATKNDTEKPL